MSPVVVNADTVSMDTTSVNKSCVGDLRRKPGVAENTGVACSANIDTQTQQLTLHKKRTRKSAKGLF